MAQSFGSFENYKKSVGNAGLTKPTSVGSSGGFEEWKKKRKSSVWVDPSAIAEQKKQTRLKLEAERLQAEQTTPPVAKPVDQMEYEKKGVLRSAMDTFSSQVLGMGELLGTGLKTKSEQIIRGNQQALDEGQAPNAIVRHQYKSNIFLAEKAIKAERAIENFFGEKRELIEEHGEINKEYLNFRKEDGKIDAKAFLEPAKVLHLGAQAAGSLIPALGIGLVTRDPRALQVTMGFVEKGDAVKSYSEKLAEEKGVSIDQLSGKDWDKIDEMSDYYGLVSGALESIVPARFISQVGGKKVLEGMVKKWIYSVPAETLRGAFTEGGTEGLQRLAQNVIAKESGISPNQDLGEGVIEEAAAGALGGGATGFFGGVAQKTIPFQQPAQPQEDKELPKEPDDTTPPPPPDDTTPVTAPTKNQNKITDFLDTINNGDEVAIEETASTLSNEELNQVVSVLDRASEQGTPAQKAVIAEHKSLVQGLSENKTKKINGTVVKDLVEDTKDFDNLNETERSEAIKVIDKISETEHETAPKAKAMRETINSNNSIIKEAIERTGEMKEELLKKKKVAETPQEKKEIQTQIDELDDQKFAFKRAENKTDISDVIETMSPELKKSMKNLTPTAKGRIIDNNKQSYERTNNNLGRTNNAGGNAGSLPVGESKPERTGSNDKENVGVQPRASRDDNGDNGKRVSKRQQLTEKHTEQQLSDAVGDMLDHALVDEDNNLRESDFVIPEKVKEEFFKKYPKKVVEKMTMGEIHNEIESMLSGEQVSETKQLKPITVVGKEKVKTSTEKTVYGRESIRFMKGVHEKTPFTTNGIILELSDVGENEGDKADSGTLERVKELIENAKANKYELSAPFGFVNGLYGVYFAFKAGNKNIVLQGKYYNYLAKKYKSLRLVANKPSDPVAIYNGEKLEGVIMPMAEDEEMIILDLPKTQQEKVAKAVEGEAKTIKQIAEETNILEPNVRRILGVGAKEGVFTRVDKGVYVLSKDGVDTAYIQTGDALEVLPKLAVNGFKADMIFLDIPYKTTGVTGGNRGIDYDTLSAEDFNDIILPAVKTIARTEDSPIVYMYSNSKAGLTQMLDYNNRILKSGLQVVAKGTYTKTYKSGKPMMFGKYLMPPEGILIFNKSGKPVEMPEAFDIKAVAPLYKGHYQTEKSQELLRAIIKGTTQVGDMVLDPFAGSGVTGEQAVKEGRKTTLIEKSEKAVEEHIKPRIENAMGETKKYTKAEIEKLAMSKDEFTEEEKNILRQYEGSGGQKDGEGRGVLDEYYTPQPIIDKIWKLVEQNIDGKIESVLEPSVGTGRFLEGAPELAKIYGLETNPISAKIAKVLNPTAIIENKPFEDTFIDEKGNKRDIKTGGVDVIVGNPPYGEHRGKYKGLGEETKIGRYEEYFIKRSLDLVREGGIVAMVVPSGFLRGKIDYAKREIAKMGELVDAYRLPNGSFGTTDVGTDIVIFRKGLSSDTNMMKELTLNSNDEFFAQNPDKVLGTEGERKGRFGMEKHTEGTLEEAMNKLTIDEVVAEQQAVEEFDDEAMPAIIEERFDIPDTLYHGTLEDFDEFNLQEAGKNTGWENAKFGIFFTDKKVLAENFIEDNRPAGETRKLKIKEAKVDIKKPLDLTLKGILTKGEQAPLVIELLGGEKGMKPKDALALLDETVDLGTVGDMFEELYSDIKNKEIMQKAGYDGIISSFGKDENGETIKEYVAFDPSQVTIKPEPKKEDIKKLEDIKKEAVKKTRIAKVKKTRAQVAKKDVLVKGVLKRNEEEPHIIEGIKKGAVKTFSQGEKLSEQDQKFLQLTEEDGSINGSSLTEEEKQTLNQYEGNFYTDFNYYQGDIYDKLQVLEQEHDAGRIEDEQYNRQKSGLEAIKPEAMPINKITLLPIDRLAKDLKLSNGKTLVDGFSEWLESLPYDALEGSSRWEIAGYLNGQPVRGGSVEQNVKERTRRRRMGNKLFKKYYNEELEATDQKNIVDSFNRTFNSYVKPDYSKYPLDVELFGKFYGKDFEIRDIQMEGAAFLVNKGVGLLAYEVGVGKTLAGIAAISNVMQKGWAKRPLIIVPKNLKSKWIRDLSESMPNVKINDLSNLGGNFKYKGDPSTLGIGEGTISVITEDGFKRIGFSDETYAKLTDNLEDVLYDNGKKSKRGKELDKAKTEEIVGKATRKTDFPVTFEQLGFDHITIDEAHRSKNIFSKAKAKGEKGESANEYGAIHGAMSERGLKTYLATQYVLSKSGGRNVFLLTATPFNNSPIEIYSMLSLMAKNRLEGLGIKNINDFISMFCEIETRYAIKANGNVQLSDQVRKFSNLQQLQKLVREYIDFRTGEEAGVPRPTKKKITPHLKMNAMQAEYVEKAQELFSPKYKQEGGTLLAISELQKITFSPYLSRYFTGSVSNVPAKDIVENSPKIKYAVEAVKKAHEANPNVGQIIFSEKGVELFRPIRDYFVKELKYKAGEVEIIDSSCSDAVKDDIQDRFQNGEVKVLLASGTVKEGVDLQKNSTDLYNLYLQWNPTDMIQAEGRTWRQGSYYDNVRIHYPLIQNSIDPFIFQKLEEKASRISNVFSYKGDSLDVSDIDFENMKFELITDPVMRVEAKYQYDKAEVDNKFTVAEAEIAFMERRTGKIAELKSDIESYTERKKEAIAQDDESDVAYYSDKLVKRKAELKEEQEKLDKKGIKVEEVSKEIEAKKAELETIKAEREKLSEQLQVDLEEAKEQKYQVISGTNDYNAMLDFMGNKGFFTHKGEEYIGRLPASFKKGQLHDNVVDKDVYARLMMVRTPYAEFEKTTKKLLKQHGLKMNVELFHKIVDKITGERALGITWGDTIGAVEFVTQFTAHHEVLHAIEDILISNKVNNKNQLPEFERFDIDTLNQLTAQQSGGNSENMSEMREKRAELFEQYVERKQQLSLPQRLKEYFYYVFRQIQRVRGFMKQVSMMSFFDQIYYGKSNEEKAIIDQNFIKKMTQYEMNENGQMKKILNVSELDIAMEFGDNLPSYKEAQDAPQKPLIKDGQISVSELYRRVYNEFYEGKAPAMNSLEDEKLTKGMTKRAFTLGKRYSTKTTKENYKQVQKDVRNYIVKNIPPKHRGELLRAVINAKSKADVDIVIDKVNEMVEKGKGREIASQKKDLMKKVYEIFLARGMTEKSTGRVNGAMLRQAVQHVAKNDGRVKMRQLTVPELEELQTIAQTLKQDKLGRIILINEIKREKLNDLLPEELQGKEFITMGDIESSIVNSDLSSGMFGLFNKNLLRAGRLAMIKNELTKKMYDKFTTADRNTANQFEAFDNKIAEMYKKATGKLTTFRDKKTDQKVIDYLEGFNNGETLNENEMALANEIVQFYADSIEVMKPNRLRKYYFTHTRQNFLESVQSVGFKQTVSEFFNQEFMEDLYSDLPPEISANLEYIVANRVFNPFGLPRKGKRFSQNLRKAMQTYARVYFTKKNFDKLYTQSNAVLTILPPNMQAFFRRYLQSAKGRPEGRAFNPAIKKVVETATTWEYIKLLGGNLASGFFNIAVGLVDNYAAMGIITKDSLVIGHGRYITPKGYQMIKKYRVTGQNITYEMTQLMHTIPEMANRILFFQLGIGEHYLRGTAFLSLLTHEEFKAGEVSDKRLSEIRHRIGEAQPLYGGFDSPVYGRHVIGKTFYMFLTWLPTRIENWVNWVRGAGSALKNEKSIMDKTINNKDLGKVIRFVSAFIVMSLMFGDRDRWKREVDQYKDLFSIGYWVNLMNPTTKPVWKDVINIGLMLKYLANQEEYTKAGTDYEKGDMKWQVYLKRLIEPTAVKRVEQGKNLLLEGWLPSEEETTVNKYQYYNSQK